MSANLGRPLFLVNMFSSSLFLSSVVTHSPKFRNIRTNQNKNWGPPFPKFKPRCQLEFSVPLSTNIIFHITYHIPNIWRKSMGQIFWSLYGLSLSFNYLRRNVTAELLPYQRLTPTGEVSKGCGFSLWENIYLNGRQLLCWYKIQRRRVTMSVNTPIMESAR